MHTTHFDTILQQLTLNQNCYILIWFLFKRKLHLQNIMSVIQHNEQTFIGLMPESMNDSSLCIYVFPSNLKFTNVIIIFITIIILLLLLIIFDARITITLILTIDIKITAIIVIMISKGSKDTSTCSCIRIQANRKVVLIVSSIIRLFSLIFIPFHISIMNL